MDLAQLTQDLDALQVRAVGAAGSAPDTAALDALEVEVLGKKGELTAILRGIGALPADDRPKVGAAANRVRIAVEQALREARASLGGSELAARLAAEAVDVTTPGRPIRRGSLHPIVETAREIAEVFAQFGFVVYEGPEIEDDVTNFQMLNIPPDHPARDLWDTLYLDVDGRLLRTHTSPGQIRVMHRERPPIRALLPGRCFRYEAVDASHASEFFQVEGLMVDEGTSMADLKGLLDQFAHAMFGADRATRFRPGLLPVHGAVRRVRHPVRHLRRGEVPGVLADGLDDDPRRRHGAPGRAALRRHRPGALPGLRLRHGRRADRQPAARRRRPPPVHGGRPALPGSVPMRVPLSWLREFVDVELTPEQLAERLTLLGMEVKHDRALGRGLGAGRRRASC